MQRPNFMKRSLLVSIIIIIILISVILISVLIVVTKSDSSKDTTENGVYYTGAVAADVGRCSDVGVDILKKNGSAVDSAIASLFCLGVTNIHSSGIGGGLFMVVYLNTTRESWFYNGRAKAPRKATRDMYINNTGLSKQGALAVGVPGEIKALHTAWLKHGRLPWRNLIQPAIDICINGFKIHDVLYQIMKKRESVLRNNTGFRNLLFDESGKMLGLNDKLVNAELGQTLKEIAEDPTSFYNGTLANTIANDIQRLGGIMTKEDLKNYDVNPEEPIKVAFDEKYDLLTSRSPSSGAVLAMILNILKGFKFSPQDRHGDINSTRSYHRMIESFKFAYAYRALLGDPAFEDVKEVVRNMTSDTFTENLRLKIFDNMTHNVSYYGGFYSDWNDAGTTHLSVVSKEGDAVAITSSINLWFGSKIRSSKLGIIYNNDMDDFSTPGMINAFGVEPSPTNFIKPGKRMMSSMAPTVVIDKSGRVRMVLGASGGTRITTAIAQVMANYLWFDMSLKDAVTRPRIHHQLVPTYIRLEATERYRVKQSILDDLAKLGHTYKFKSTSSVVQTITVDESGGIRAFSDPRKNGRAAGY